jgi:hypothetical protein
LDQKFATSVQSHVFLQPTSHLMRDFHLPGSVISPGKRMASIVENCRQTWHEIVMTHVLSSSWAPVLLCWSVRAMGPDIFQGELWSSIWESFLLRFARDLREHKPGIPKCVCLSGPGLCWFQQRC